MFYDLKDENWRNSEVMRLFAANMVSEHPMVVRSAHDVPTDPPTPPKLSESTEKYKKHLEVQQILAELDTLSASLTKIASNAGLSGNVRVAYEVERTIDELSDLGHQVIEESDV